MPQSSWGCCWAMEEKRNHQFKQNSYRGSLEYGVINNGQVEWRGNNFMSKEACRGSLECEVNTKRKHLLPHCVKIQSRENLRFQQLSFCLNIVGDSSRDLCHDVSLLASKCMKRGRFAGLKNFFTIVYLILWHWFQFYAWNKPRPVDTLVSSGTIYGIFYEFNLLHGQSLTGSVFYKFDLLLVQTFTSQIFYRLELLPVQSFTSLVFFNFKFLAIKPYIKQIIYKCNLLQSE